MKRWAVPLLVAVVLFATSVVAERSLQHIDRGDPLGRELLFLPSVQMLRLASLGNAGLMADALYLWSIQYYGQYQPHERFLYLEPVYDLITDLDPLYYDAYRIGALIMQVPNTDVADHKQSVIRLFDKALRNLPENYEIAETAGWDLFIRYRDKGEGIRYFKAAAAIPGSPIRIKRFLVAWREDEEGWSVDDAISYWIDVRDSSDDEYNRVVSERQIYRLVESRDKERIDPILEKWKLWHGRCPETWEGVVDSGFLRQVPLDYFGHPYLILAEDCTIKGADSVRFD